VLAKHGLLIWIMPCNVKTHWNSTYDMLTFALKYRDGINELISNLKNGLCDFELDDTEWDLAEGLRDILKVMCYLLSIM
jgi:hypothetical protein